jgi:hypothetical protein
MIIALKCKMSNMLREDPFSRSMFLLFCIRFWTEPNTLFVCYFLLRYLFILTAMFFDKEPGQASNADRDRNVF